MIFSLAIVLASVVSQPPRLSTEAERSGFVRTGRYDEVVSLCEAFQAAYPKRARCFTFGTTPQGRDMKALVLSDLSLDAGKAPAVLVQGGIHAGEIDGKDAGFLVARELLDGKIAPGILGKLAFVFVPVFNVDGSERRTKNNRPNQRGPEEMGWRTTAHNLNLNRDYVKAEAPEMQAMLRLLNAWDPIVYADLHVTDGAQFQHDVAVMVDPALTGPEPLGGVARALRDDVIQELNAHGHMALDFYPSFDVEGDPSSGITAGVAPPRFSQAYWALHNRIGILVETHSWKDYKTRVRSHHDVIGALLHQAALHLDEWTQAARALDDAKAQRVVLSWENTDETRTIDFQGYQISRELSPISGAIRTSYDEGKPTVWKVPLKPAVKPLLSVDLPRGGYIVPAAHAAWVKAKLDLHGVTSIPVTTSRAMTVEMFRADVAKFGERPYEGRQTASVKGAWTKETRSIEKGSLFISSKQRLGRLVAHMFEPTAPDSLVYWGYFNAFFEQKEYMESYVAEAVATEMLKDPTVKAEFQKKLETEPEFAKDPGKRLDFFYRKHPSWDAQKDVVPVFRVDTSP